MTVISFYKTLSDIPDFKSTVEDLEVGCDRSDLTLKSTSEGFVVADENEIWDIRDDGLTVKGRILIPDVSQLFGNSGLVSDNCVLGVAVITSSTIADRRDVFKIGVISSCQDSANIVFEISLQPGLYRGNMLFRAILYIVSPGEYEKAKGLPSGLMLGDLFSSMFVFTNYDSVFPVLETDSPGSPLWWVKCQWTDIEKDTFTPENVCIYINTAHKLYPSLKEEGKKKTFNVSLFAEIMCSSIQLIIEKIRCSETDWEKIMSDSTFPMNTIVFVIQYIRLTLEWDFSSPERLASDIRKYVYSSLGVE